MKKTEKIKLVIADDAPFIREIVRQICHQDKGIDLVGEAEDGQKVVTMAKKLKPDVILMDIVMPKQNGIDATKEIVEKDSKVRVIAFSTVDQESMMLKALEAGCCNYLTKPFNSEDLVSIIYKSAKGAN